MAADLLGAIEYLQNSPVEQWGLTAIGLAVLAYYLYNAWRAEHA